ncbi:MAG: ribonuclease H-like domain-containing protein, partial [Candidatus Micrarchaeota archaeon]
QNDHLTVVGIFDGKDTHSYIHGKNMEQFAKDISSYDMVVTFNGSMFDIPFLKSHIPGLKMPRLHADLRFILASLNVRGGLKRIEQQFGLEREDDLKGMNGYDAVLLWRRYRKSGDEGALDKLVRYNAADISNLKALMGWAYKEKRGRTGFDDILRATVRD